MVLVSSSDGRNAKLKARIERWREAFTDDTTGIFQALGDMTWNYAVFMMAIAIVRRANQRGSAGPALNPIFFDLIADSYWPNLLIGIRRLTDRADLHGDRGVYSLRSVVADIRAARPKLTRRVFLEDISGLEYDLEKMQAEAWADLTSFPPGTAVWGNVEVMHCKAKHEQFDFLSGKTASIRSPNDKIQEAIFDRIEARLAKLDTITNHVSTHLAHAGNKQSRSGKRLDTFSMTSAREALMELVQIADLVGTWFANEGFAGLAVYQADKFEGLDQPMTDAAGIADMEEQWSNIDRDVSQWTVDADDL